MTVTVIQDEEAIWNVTFYNDQAKTDPVDPGTVTLRLEGPDGSVVEPDVDEDGSRPANVGKYTASHIFDEYGTWDWRWITDTPRIVKQDTIKVIQRNVES